MQLTPNLNTCLTWILPQTFQNTHPGDWHLEHCNYLILPRWQIPSTVFWKQCQLPNNNILRNANRIKKYISFGSNTSHTPPLLIHQLMCTSKVYPRKRERLLDRTPVYQRSKFDLWIQMLSVTCCQLPRLVSWWSFGPQHGRCFEAPPI